MPRALFTGDLQRIEAELDPGTWVPGCAVSYRAQAIAALQRLGCFAAFTVSFRPTTPDGNRHAGRCAGGIGAPSQMDLSPRRVTPSLGGPRAPDTNPVTTGPNTCSGEKVWATLP